MVAQLLAFLGSVFNMVIDSVYKIIVAMFLIFLAVMALAAGFAYLIIWLLV